MFISFPRLKNAPVADLVVRGARAGAAEPHHQDLGRLVPGRDLVQRERSGRFQVQASTGDPVRRAAPGDWGESLRASSYKPL